MKIHKFIAVKR